MQNTQFQPLPYPQTLKSAKSYFLQHGINRSEWARHFGINQQTISDFFRGKLKGTWGESHHVAVLLGVKENPDQEAA